MKTETVAALERIARYVGRVRDAAEDSQYPASEVLRWVAETVARELSHARSRQDEEAPS